MSETLDRGSLSSRERFVLATQWRLVFHCECFRGDCVVGRSHSSQQIAHYKIFCLDVHDIPHFLGGNLATPDSTGNLLRIRTALKKAPECRVQVISDDNPVRTVENGGMQH